MKATLLPYLIFLLFCFGTSFVEAQQQPAPARNVILFVMDGYRWQELFEGADSSLLFSQKYNHTDSAWMATKYWSPYPEERKHKLMPFVWETIAKKGQLYQAQYAQTIAALLGFHFTAQHPVAPVIQEALAK